ncbi:hypothetical protein X737_38740 [Mesorhizobium sp. L48C026A00]|nr:hypothetical protein X737_38740 [Mesorhizobium sp. L48C026A00]
MLVDIADAAIETPDGRVCDVIFPVAGKDKLEAIVKEHRAKGTLERHIYQVMRGSYAGHYRRILPKLLSVLEFRSNNAVHRPVVEALDWIRQAFDTGCRVVPRNGVPIEGVIPPKGRSAIIGKDGRINQISYELCVLSQLRDRIRGRNPDDDLPKDFEAKRAAYYGAELLDVLKETALDTGFLDAFETSASRVTLSRGALDRRLILCLYGLGTNAGLKRVAAGCPDVS